jgi:hypothetical protein
MNTYRIVLKNASAVRILQADCIKFDPKSHTVSFYGPADSIMYRELLAAVHLDKDSYVEKV